MRGRKKKKYFRKIKIISFLISSFKTRKKKILKENKTIQIKKKNKNQKIKNSKIQQI